MDPNETLARLRTEMHDEQHFDAGLVMELFDALDGWLSKGGFLPDAWTNGGHRGAKRVDIIHRRDPDYECTHEVYVDGHRATIDRFYEFDPGHGYEMSEFDENKRAEVDAAPDFLKERIAAIYDEMKPVYEKWSTS